MLVTASNLCKNFGADKILQNLSFRLNHREKLALIGKNGCGKSTLMKILAGEYKSDSGSVLFAPGVRIGYLSQHTKLNKNHTIIQEAQEAIQEVIELKKKLQELEKKLEKDCILEDLDEYALLVEHFQNQQGYQAEQSIDRILSHMGFPEAAYSKKVSSLSGGEKTRLTLAKILLNEPDILLLDEPTNHLDLNATEWLEEWLKSYFGAVILVSHDRVFLQNVASRILEMESGAVKSYPGPFEHYLKLKEEENERFTKVAAMQQEEAQKLDEFVRRFMNSQRTAQAKGRLKKLEKLKSEQIEAPKEGKKMHAHFSKAERSGDIVFNCKNLSMAFGDQKLFSELDWQVNWKQRWGVIGSNGVGKSTLIKIILGTQLPITGTAKLGSRLTIGYFSQDAQDIDLDLSPVELLLEECNLNAPEARSLLGRFLVSGDDAFRPIRTFSGGERNKVVLAKIVAQNPNLLILDEPTNHLDMDSCQALAKVLKEYEGTLIMISHDRWLLHEIADHILEISPYGNQIFDGGFQEFQKTKKHPINAKSVASSQLKETPKQAPSNLELNQQGENTRPLNLQTKEIFQTPFANLTQREISKKITDVQKKIVDIEKEIEQSEKELEELETEMSSPDPSRDHHQISQNHVKLQKKLEITLHTWDKENKTLEQLRSLQGK